jgi:hypothetical protein
VKNGKTWGLPVSQRQVVAAASTFTKNHPSLINFSTDFNGEVKVIHWYNCGKRDCLLWPLPAGCRGPSCASHAGADLALKSGLGDCHCGRFEFNASK